MSKTNIIIRYILGIVLILFLIWSYKSNKKDEEILRIQGDKTKGVIIKVVDRKRGLDIKYQFVVQNKSYESWGKTYKTVNLGDTIEVIYNVNDPSISKLSFIK